MTDTLKEQLSACLDGQLPEAELDLLLKRVVREPELRQTLGRYSLAGEALRGAGAVRASTGFADRVAAAIAAEGVAPQRRGRIASGMLRGPVSRWLGPAAGAAVAAGVAAIAVFSLQPAEDGDEPAMVALTAPSAVDSADRYVVPANTVSNFVPATRLTNYVVAHSEYSSPLGRRTVLSGMLSEEDEPQDAVNADPSPDDSGVLDSTQSDQSPGSMQRP
jgi:sigma-E factor negative regulatory protein RseA